MFWRKPDRRWNPYLAGALAGLLATAAAYATTRVMGETMGFGFSQPYVGVAGMLMQQGDAMAVAARDCLATDGALWAWQGASLFGLFLGALAAALSGRAFVWQGVPDRWRRRFGPSVLKRAAGGFAGGILVLFGVRLADGCPSGLVLSGTMQLSISSLVAMASFFLGGVVGACYLNKRGSNHD